MAGGYDVVVVQSAQNDRLPVPEAFIATVATFPIGPKTLGTELLEKESSSLKHDFNRRPEMTDWRQEEGPVEERIPIIDGNRLLTSHAGHSPLVVCSESLQ